MRQQDGPRRLEPGALRRQLPAEFTDFARKLEFTDLTFIPVSAALGDNVIQHSPNTPWYQGPTLLWYLENVYTGSDRNLIDPRFPVQYVVRPHSNDFHDYRGFAGTVAGGAFRPGDEVTVLPSGLSARLRTIDTFDGPVQEAFPNMSVSVRLADDLDVSRGDMICRPHNQPHVIQDVEAMVCWLSEGPPLLHLEPLRHQAHDRATGRAVVKGARVPARREHPAPAGSRREPGPERDRSGDAAHHGAADGRRVPPEPADGQLILVDEATHETMGAGMILGESQ